MKLRKVLYLFVAALMVLSFSARDSQAITIGLPDIGFDSATSTDQLTFTVSTGVLNVTAPVIALTMPGYVTTNPGGTVSYSMNLVNVESASGVTTAYFGTSALANDLTIYDGSNTLLLSGEFIQANMTGVNGLNFGAGDALFTVTGGSLAGYFANTFCGDCGGMVNLSFNLSVPFSSTMFSSSFTGEAKGDIGTVPEPSTLLFLGSGLVGAGMWFRRRSRA